MSGNRKAELWVVGGPDDDGMTATSVAEAVEDELDIVWPMEGERPLDPDEKWTVTGWAPREIDRGTIENQAAWALDMLLENLDEEYGSPHDATKKTPDMESLAETFVREVVKLYHVWQCDQVDQVEVRIGDYMEVRW